MADMRLFVVGNIGNEKLICYYISFILLLIFMNTGLDIANTCAQPDTLATDYQWIDLTYEPGDRPSGWYWVKRYRLVSEDNKWTPAQWDAETRHWNSVGFGGIPDTDILVGEPLIHPSTLISDLISTIKKHGVAKVKTRNEMVFDVQMDVAESSKDRGFHTTDHYRSWRADGTSFRGNEWDIVKIYS